MDFSDPIISRKNLLIGHPFEERGIEIFVQREDLIHPEISGNKWRKLKYNVLQAKKEGKGLLTFGGAYSNHIAATASAGKEFGLPTIGIIRGDELTIDSNDTLQKASSNGMQFQFISRSDYKNRNESDYLDHLQKDYPNYWVVPEGGANYLGIKGCEEILDKNYDLVFCAAGTGSTSAGIVNSGKAKEVKVVSALKGDFLKKEIEKWTISNQWELITDYHFGGYGKTTNELFAFIRSFHYQHEILLDPIYTGKCFYGAFEFLNQHTDLKNLKIALIHTGGLQGWKGFPQFKL